MNIEFLLNQGYNNNIIIISKTYQKLKHLVAWFKTYNAYKGFKRSEFNLQVESYVF